MRSVLFLALSLLLCSFDGYRKCETCAKSDLKGNVKFLNERIVTGDKDAVGGKYEFEQKVYHYDKKGRLTWRSDSTYVYDKITKRGVSNVYVELYTYKKGRLQKITSGPDRSPVIQKFTYDGLGRKVMVEQYTLVPETKTIRTDRMLSILYIHGTAHMIRKALVSGEVKIISKEKEEYDNSDRKIRSLKYDERGEKYLTTNEYTYDTEGNVSEEKMYNTFNGNVQSTTKYIYDLQGRLDKVIQTMTSGAVNTTTYTYSDLDKQDNYLKVIIATDTQPPVITRRFISYY